MSSENVYNPYDVNSKDYDPRTLPLDEIIRRAIRSALMSTRVCMPCKVSKVHGNQQVDLQPLFKTLYVGKTDAQDMPMIQNCPVNMPMGQNYSIKLPVAVGDTGYAIFNDRSMETWLAGGGESTDPLDSRAHDITDAVFVPGLVPFSKQTTDATTDLVLTNGNSQIRMEQSGKLKIQNTAANQELINIIDKLIETLISETFTMTFFGPQPFLQFTIQKLTQIQNDLGELKS